MLWASENKGVNLRKETYLFSLTGPSVRDPEIVLTIAAHVSESVGEGC